MQHDNANSDLLDAIPVSSAFPSGHYQLMFWQSAKMKYR
jgi:hypothetical protein